LEFDALVAHDTLLTSIRPDSLDACRTDTGSVSKYAKGAFQKNTATMIANVPAKVEFFMDLEREDRNYRMRYVKMGIEIGADMMRNFTCHEANSLRKTVVRGKTVQTDSTIQPSSLMAAVGREALWRFTATG
jgi:hypothetical protein